MNTLIFRLITWLLAVNAKLYGRGASFEICRDVQAPYWTVVE